MKIFPIVLALLTTIPILTGCSRCRFTENGTTQATPYTPGSAACAGVTASAFGVEGTVAVDPTRWNNSAACGTCYQMVGPGGTAKVVVADYCPGCPTGQPFDLASDMFIQLNGGGPASGIIDVTAAQMPCNDAPHLVTVMEASNAFYLKIRVYGHRTPVEKVEWVDGSGNVTALARTSDNAFEVTASVGSGPYDFRVTDIFGAAVTVTGVPLVNTTPFDSSVQFPSC